jgi:hypothetical protein
MAYIKDNDIQAFMTAGNVSEVYGLWTKHSKRQKIQKRIDEL